MHYYKFNIGDYASHTQHLDPIEDIAYRRMLDWLYLNEMPLPLDVDDIARLIRMRSHSDCIAVVLREFFQSHSEGYTHIRVERELSVYQERSNKAKKSAEARWKNKASKTGASGDANALRTECEGNAKHKPLTTKQEPLNKNQETDSPKRTKKPESFKAFFAAYPPNKKGGTDATAWKKAKSLGLGDDDFKAMLANVQQRQVQCPSWYMQFAKGITRYMEERDWLTPIIPEVAPRETADQRRQRIIDERNQNLGLTAASGNGNLFEGEVINHE